MFINDSGHKKWKQVTNAFTELYKKENTIVLDAGKYGFAKLQYYHTKTGIFLRKAVYKHIIPR